MPANNQWLLTALLNSVWLVAGIAIIALLCEKLLRGTAAQFRHRLWVAALAASICLPIIVSTRLPFDLHFSQPNKIEMSVSAPPKWQAEPLTLSSLTLSPLKSVDLSTPAEQPARLQIGSKVAGILVAIYLLFVLCKIGALLIAWARTNALIRTATFTELPGPIQAVVKRCESVFGLSRVRVLFSTVVSVPIAAGIVRPLVILPEQMLDESDTAILTSAIGHELVHVRRRDFALNLFYEFICLPISFHPAAALIRRRIKQTRELRCDEIVAEQLMEPGAYARSLVELAGCAAPLGQTMRTISLGINDADILEERVMNMLHRPKISIRRRNLMVIAASILFAMPCVAAAPFALHLTIARDSSFAPGQEAGQSSSQEEREKKEKQEAEARSKSGSATRPIYSPPAEYTEDARAKKIEGTVLLTIKIGTDGLVKDAKITRSLYQSLDASAMRTVRTWRFEPAMKDGKAISIERTVGLNFHFNPGSAEQGRREEEQVIASRERLERMQKEHDVEKRAALQQLEKEIAEQEKKLRDGSNEMDREAKERAEKQLLELREEQQSIGEKSEREARKKHELDLRKLETEQRGWAISRENEERTRKQQEEESVKRRAELAGKAKISMSQAIQIASKEQEGNVVECTLQGEGNQIFYRVEILSNVGVSFTKKNEGSGSAPSVTTNTFRTPNTILIDAMDGHVIRHETHER